MLRFAFFVCAAAALACTGPEPIAVTIAEVQGSGARTPCENRVVTVEGIVTGSFSGMSGFFIQDPVGDGNPATSDGLFIFPNTRDNLPAAGSRVRVTGRAVEFGRSGYTGTVTELDLRASATPLARVDVIGAGTIPPPVALPSEADLERFEGMFVSVPESVVVMPSNRFGEYFALPRDRVPARVRPTNADPGPGTPLMIDTAGNSVRRDVKTFDLVPALTGPLHFDFGYYRLEPRAAYLTDDAGYAPVPALEGAPFLSAASINTERLTRRDQQPAALERKLEKLSRVIRDQLRSPDLIGLQEVGEQDVVDLLAARAGDYAGVVLNGCDFGGINVALLYKRSRVRIASATQLQSEAPEFRNGRCTLPDGRAFTQFLYDRPPLRVDLEVEGAPYTVVVNHWRSQIGGNEAERLAGARFLDEELRRNPAANLIVLGDFNDTEDSAPLAALAPLLENQTWYVPNWSRYTLLFEGRSLAYDHILLSPNLRGKVVRVGVAHQNADFPVAPHAENAQSFVRAADHDTPWVHLAR